MFSSFEYYVKTYPIWSAFVEFAVLGTLGELVTLKMTGALKKLSVIQYLLKVLSWGFLGIIIKYGFFGYKSMINAFVEHGYFPHFLFSFAVLKGFTISVIVNLFFGPQMMFIHRIMDNLIERKWEFRGMDKAVYTLVWFWIPAHTITFILPQHLQITLAAVWSIVLGIVMGFSKK